MPIPYKVIRQCTPGVKGSATGKYYVRAVHRGKISIHQVCERIADRSTFSFADTVGVVTALKELIPDLLMDGYSVDLDTLGIFKATITGKGAEEPSKLTSRSIAGVKVHFRPSIWFKEVMKGAKFVKVTLKK